MNEWMNEWVPTAQWHFAYCDEWNGN
jgi:hypothetical protein